MKTGLSIYARDRSGLLRDVAACIAAHGGNIEAIHLIGAGQIEMHLELENLDDPCAVEQDLMAVEDVARVTLNQAAGQVFGKRVIVIGGGAQVSQVVFGAVSEADRHNIRGERISVDTMALIGEQKIAEAVRAVGRLPRARILVLAGSLMGGEITEAVRELQAQSGIPVICLNMVGSVTSVADLVISDPIQAGVMAVMTIADTASFDITRVRGRHM
jgi:energy-converting hydrogenase B subunit Q